MSFRSFLFGLAGPAYRDAVSLSKQNALIRPEMIYYQAMDNPAASDQIIRS